MEIEVAGRAMDSQYLPEFGGAYLEDSYFLGITAEGADLRLKMLFALTVDHPAYAPPAPGDPHCYREGSLLIERPKILLWRPGPQKMSTDPDGSVDFGDIEISRSGHRQFHICTDWFEATVETAKLELQLAPTGG